MYLGKLNLKNVQVGLNGWIISNQARLVLATRAKFWIVIWLAEFNEIFCSTWLILITGLTVKWVFNLSLGT